MTYTITVHNKQGASDVFRSPSKAGIERYLASWHDPHNLTARVRDTDGKDVASKPLGRKHIQWTIR